MSDIQPVASLLPPEAPAKRGWKKDWIFYILLLLVLGSGAYFRFLGVKWDDGTHLHPDERFLTMVETSLTPVQSLSQYFNTLDLDP